ncbi:bifunctional oligoribonuclease/PAP phosphatase NrnA [Solwaraspora sp. WMMD1047]|uniref:DHH family phosphoesterase n=1 Tax=Solwaraspora sp. WMMD1047 TaxID=3016102 RepID=UPI002417E697|nr:bifunctional oligoribonuclease/PAP phosphatase NrnA [Solwaraspora sp. WMMD1047]MDG4829669.1 bifunctional oligoribonuclease/PAP phosphatase NrnA [Solwaraspora sp. WMMD1047]
MGEPAGAEGPVAGDATGPTEAEWAAAVAAVRDLPPDRRVLLICHVNPDGDALGSMLGFALGLRRLGYRAVQATFPGRPELPEAFQAMPGLDLLVPAAAAWTDPDLVLSFDAASASRLGELADRLTGPATAVVIDHHASNTRFGTVHLVDPTAAATSVVVEQLLDRLGVPLDVEIAECLYVALATDTGSFRFEMTTPAVHEMAARLLATGLRPGEISRRIFDTRPFGAVRLYGDVLRRTRLEPEAVGGRGLVWTYATLDDLARHRQRPPVLEPLIDSIRCTAEADVSCLVKQVAPGEWAVSLRSKGGVDVSAVAVALGGGGHRLAAGFTGRGEVEEVVAAVRAELPGTGEPGEDQG